MEELKQYLNDHKLFRLTPEMIEKIVQMVYEHGLSEWNEGLRSRYE